MVWDVTNLKIIYNSTLFLTSVTSFLHVWMYAWQDDPDIAAIDYVVLDEVHGKYFVVWCGVV